MPERENPDFVEWCLLHGVTANSEEGEKCLSAWTHGWESAVDAIMADEWDDDEDEDDEDWSVDDDSEDDWYDDEECV